jgi:hypothetical protein
MVIVCAATPPAASSCSANAALQIHRLFKQVPL